MRDTYLSSRIRLDTAYTSIWTRLGQNFVSDFTKYGHKGYQNRQYQHYGRLNLPVCILIWVYCSSFASILTIESKILLFRPHEDQ